jgi:imidazolonepropionase-like amidohydrolase
MRLSFCTSVAIAAICSSTLAQDAPSVASTVIHAGRLLDKPGEPARGPSTIVISNGKIVSVSAGYSVPGGSVLRVIDLKDKFVMPGLIDSHVHLTSDAGGVAAQLEEVTKNPATLAYQAEANARKTLMAGFTTVRNLGDGDGTTLALRDAIEEGLVVGPRILDAGTSISVTSGHMDGTLGFRDDLHEHFAAAKNTCDGADDCRKTVRRQIGRGADVIKIATTGGVNSRIGAGIGKQMFDDEARAVADTAHLHKKKLAVHAHATEGIKLALEAGADSIEHGTVLDEDTIKLFLKSGAYLVPTLSTVNGYLERQAKDPNAYAPAVRAKIDWRIKITGENVRKAHPRGVKIAFGTDAGVSKHGRNADEFELLVKNGMSPTAALKAATVNAADLLGLSADIGSLETGKSADIVAVSGDPLNDVTVLKKMFFVMAKGAVIKE